MKTACLTQLLFDPWAKSIGYNSGADHFQFGMGMADGENYPYYVRQEKHQNDKFCSELNKRDN